ncbi:NADP(+)-dependent dehydrogenase [Penicillium brevicompactum]|uniref:NADP(+)-dependent dehydrogenase n=1 Tax=Penicillium brevicompactum TaxID=5074 RepID=A0A9W9Q1A6_PENBR|nr:NADP(+)-dependent dehydrogenase [Penicillium brevicompactum]
MDSAFTHAVFRQGATALITGAASGIGLALAKRCYSCQMNLILLDKRDDGLQQALRQFPSTETITTTTHSIDIEAQYPEGIDLLVLNAGTGVKPNKGYWKDHEYFEKTFAINTLGYTNGIIAILDMVKGSNEARAIILTGSKQVITNLPSDPAYNASKAAVRTISEHPSFDMVKDALNVSLHLLVPAWTYNGFYTAASKDKPVVAWTSEQVVDFMIQKMAEGKLYIMCLDNEVSEELDRRRFTWTTNDLLEGRLPLSRWREE